LPCKSVADIVGPQLGEGNYGEKLIKTINIWLDLSTKKAFKHILITEINL
jgi:hypothetical protein